MNEISFFIPLRKIPSVTAQEQKTGVRNGKPYRYDTPELKAVKALFRDHLAQHAPPEPLGGPISLSVMWLYEATGEHKSGEWKTSKPDTDNLLKAFKDALTKVGFWMDDAQVCRELNTKIYSDDYTGIAVTVEQLPQTLEEYINAW